MRILSLCNISNIDDIEADSGIIYQRVIGKALTDMGHEYHVVLPRLLRNIERCFYSLSVHYAEIGTDRYSSRFGFDWSSITRIIIKTMPDVVFVNQIENAAAVRATLTTIQRSDIAVITYCHYPPFQDPNASNVDKSLDHDNLGRPILLLVAAALHTSDAVVTQSRYAASILYAASAAVGSKYKAHIYIVPPPVDPEVCPHTSDDRIPASRNILYNHRLYESYGTEHFIKYLESRAGCPINVVIADPMANRSAHRNRLSGSPAILKKRLSCLPFVTVVNGSSSRQGYRSVLKSCGIAFAPRRIGCVWSMAAVDCLSWGMPVLAPRIAAYPEFIPETTLFDDWVEADRILSRLLESKNAYQDASVEARSSVDRLSPNHIASELVHIFSREIRRRQCAV